jgi:2-methylcitrate dehydratase
MTDPGAYTSGRIAQFAVNAGPAQLSAEARQRLRLIVLDTVGCALGALSGEPVKAVRGLASEFGGAGQCAIIGGGRAAPDRASLVNGCLVRYLDFMDNYGAKGEVCHPADNFAALLAAAEYADRSGEDLLLALAVAYQVQGLLIESWPTMRAGVNYTTPLAFSVAAGASRLLGLDVGTTAHALALAGVGAVSLATIQAEPVSQWKGLASGEAASRALHNCFLARAGITGPLGVFDGPQGYEQLVGGGSEVDWERQPLDAVLRTSIKKHNAEYQSQTAIEAAIRLKTDQPFDPGEIEAVAVDCSDGAYQVLGGGKYGGKDDCRIKEQADHNLKYLVAVALLDGQVQPEQFATPRINAPDVQDLLRRVSVRSNAAFTRKIPNEMPVRLSVRLRTGRELSIEAVDYDGFHARPMRPDQVRAKFDRLARAVIDPGVANEIAAAVDNLESIQVRALAGLLERVRTSV